MGPFREGGWGVVVAPGAITWGHHQWDSGTDDVRDLQNLERLGVDHAGADPVVGEPAPLPGRAAGRAGRPEQVRDELDRHADAVGDDEVREVTDHREGGGG